MKARRFFFFMLVLIAGVAAAYSSSFHGQFVFDDRGRIIENPALRSIAETAGSISTRYLVDISFAVDYAFGGLNPAYFHFTNLLLHLACVLVLFALVRRLLLRMGRTEERAEWIAFISALLWGVHPLTTSAVTYICQRYEVMMSLFYLLAMWALAEGRSRGGWKGSAWLVVSVVSCLSGMLCKQVMITAPLVLFMLDVSFFRKGWRDFALRRWWYYAALLASWAALGLLIRIDSDNHMAMFDAYSAGQGKLMYLLNQAPVLLHYLRLSFWPYPLAIDYAWLPASDAGLLILPAVAVVLLFVMVSYGLFRWPRAFFAGACVFVILSPTSSFIPIPDLAFEHRMYLPLAGLVVSVAAFAAGLVRGRKACAAVVLLSFLAASAAGYAAFMRNGDFADPERLWGDVVERIPHNFRARFFLAEEQFQKGDLVAAERSVRQMLARADLLLAGSEQVYNVPSSYPPKYRAIGRNLLGRILLGRGMHDEALICFSELVHEYPSDIDFRHNKALALLALGRVSDAESELDKVLSIAPGFRQAGMVKALLLAESGRHRPAADQLRLVLEQYPGFVPARVELAWLLGASYHDDVRDCEEALRLLEGIEAELGVTSRVLDIKAAAYAGRGIFDVAVEMQEQALNLAVEHAVDDDLIQSITDRLDLYRKGYVFLFGCPENAEDD